MDWELLKGTKRIITHANCPDGMGSAVILRHVFPDIEPEFYHHSQPEYLDLPAEEGMLFCDIIPPEHRAEEFVEVNAVVLDHHKGVEHIVEMFGERGVFADEKKEPGISGTTLAWREVYLGVTEELRKMLHKKDSVAEGEVEDFARLAGIRDTWQKDHSDFPIACQQAAMLTFYSWDYWRSRLDETEAGFPDLSKEMDVGRKIYEKRLREAEKCVEFSVVFEKEGLKVAIFNDPDRLCSDVAEMHRKNGVDVIAGFYYFKKNNEMYITYSLRSGDKFNVGEMASHLGGGGHSKASGFSFPMNVNSVNPFTKFADLFSDYVRKD